jgi:AcrR family transcriptional regulator
VARTIPDGRFRELIEAATSVFLEQGYRRTQMADVASRAGVAKGTVYLYFESKDALFDAVLRHAGTLDEPELPKTLPLPTPRKGATLEMVRNRVADEAVLPVLALALERRRVTEIGAEVEEIVRELYALFSRHRASIKLLDRCALEHPELAAVWFGTGREATVDLLRRYLEDRVRRRRLPAVQDAGVTARLVLEMVVLWAVHRHWDPSPQRMEEQVAEDCVVQFIRRGLAGDT